MRPSIFSLSFLLVSSLFFSNATPSLAASCQLGQGEILQIGCTYRCSKQMKRRISRSAKRLGYRISFRDLQKETLNQGLREADLSEIDAVIIPGGADIDPNYYVADLPIELRDWIMKNRHLYKDSAEGRKRDPFEYDFAKTYLNDSRFETLPVLGICRGMQMLTVASGIPLYIDIKTELRIPNPKLRFQIFRTIDRQSIIGEKFGKGAAWAWENHHQGFRYDYFKENQNQFPEVRVTADSNRGKIAEAIEFSHRPALGVQFHPESSQPKIAKRIFSWLLENACANHNKGRKI